MTYEQILSYPCDKRIAKELIEAGYYCPSYKSIDRWLWQERGIKLNRPTREVWQNYYTVCIQYLNSDGQIETHPICGEDGTPEGAYRDALGTVLDLLVMERPGLYWWERIARRLGLLGETKSEKWFRERVIPLQASKPLNPSM